MQCNRGILRSKYWFTIQKCLVVWRFWFNFSIAGIPNIHTRYLLVENSNFIGDKSERMPGSSRAEDVCWDKQGHQGLSTLIHNTMHLRIDNNTMHPMQIIHNIVYLYITLTTLCLCAIYSALIHNTMHFCIILCTHWQQYASQYNAYNTSVLSTKLSRLYIVLCISEKQN